MRINLLTIGTRGDVQPFIALGRGLKDAGYKATLTSLQQFKSLAEEYGLNYFSIRGDYLELAQKKDKKFNPLKRIRQYKKMARDTLIDEWESIKNADVLIYNPAALGGHSIAGKPSIICPVVGDQTFWGNRISKLGAGPDPIPQKKLTAKKLSELIKYVTTDNTIKTSAKIIGKKIRAEDGVKYAIDFINKKIAVH